MLIKQDLTVVPILKCVCNAAYFISICQNDAHILLTYIFLQETRILKHLSNLTFFSLSAN
jgi:hypothetical protein